MDILTCEFWDARAMLHCCCNELVAFLSSFSSDSMAVFVPDPFSLSYTEYMQRVWANCKYYTCSTRTATHWLSLPGYQHQEVAIANLKDVHCMHFAMNA